MWGAVRMGRIRSGRTAWLCVLVAVMLGALHLPVSATSVSCCPSWAVVLPDRHAVLRALVGRQGEVREHAAQAGGQYRVAPFPLTIAEVIKPSFKNEQVGDGVQLWVIADDLYGIRPTDAIRDLAGQEAVFLVAVTEGSAYPEGYSLYAAPSYWTITAERVTGGTDGIRLENAPYAELVAKVRSAMRERTPRKSLPVPAVTVTVLLAAAGCGLWAWWKAVHGPGRR